MGRDVITKGKSMIYLIIHEGFGVTNGTKYSRMDQVKFMEDSL